MKKLFFILIYLTISTMMIFSSCKYKVNDYHQPTISTNNYLLNTTNKINILNEPGTQPIYFGNTQPFRDENGIILVPVSYIDKLLRNIDYEIDSDIITITQKGFEYTTVLKVEVGNKILYKNDTPLEMDAIPVYKDDQIYIPIEYIAKVLDHDVSWNDKWNELDITYDAVEIYVWNENEDSSPDGVKYAIMQATTRQKELSEIYNRAVSDYKGIESQFDKIPNGTTVIITLYKLKGYKLPYEKVKEIDDALINRFGYKRNAIDYTLADGSKLIDEVPLIIQGTGDYSDRWYSEQLIALDESDLRNSNKQIYRFTYLPAFYKPITIRIEVLSNGGGVLYSTVCDGPRSPYGGEIIGKLQKSLDKDKIDKLFKLIDSNDYWNIPVKDDNLGLDGAEMIIEGVKNGNYHIVDRWSPQKGAIYDLGHYIVSLYNENIILENWDY